MNATGPQLESDPSTTPKRSALALRFGVAFLVLFGVVLSLHLVRGAFGTGFGSFDDEPSHLVTGLLFYDYLTQGCPGSPLEFARDYYLHYPKVGIGQWPPMFYLSEAVWMLVGGDDPISLLCFASAIVALFATLLFALLRPHIGGATALLFSVVLLVLPLVQTLSSTLMTETELALFCTATLAAFACYLAEEKRSALVWFSLCAAAAILTKGNGMALALLPPIAMTLNGSWFLLRRVSLWIAGLGVAVLCAPWYVLTVKISAGTWDGGVKPSFEYAAYALPNYLHMMWELGGPALAIGVALGVVLRPRERRARALWSVLCAWPLAWLVFHLIVPSSVEARHLLLVAPALVGLAALGVYESALRWLPAHSPWRAAPALLLIAGLLPFVSVPEKPHREYGAAVDAIFDDPALDKAVLLVASDAIGEGLIVGEAALRDRRPNRYVLRASKVLASMNWSGGDYTERFENPELMADFLRLLPVGVILYDHSVIERRQASYYADLYQVISARKDLYELHSRRDVVRDGTLRKGALEIYRSRFQPATPQKALDPHVVFGAEYAALQPMSPSDSSHVAEKRSIAPVR